MRTKAGYHAVAHLHHTWLTAQVLALVVHESPQAAENVVFELFRRQHLASFRPGIVKLGLDREPDAVAAAKYHYLSNQLGGVKVEYATESPTKAWIRYPPPRWIWHGSAIAAIPSRVNIAMLRGWHAQSGVSLGNSRLGFVCTGTTVDGAAGLEGYYLEYDHPLSESERLRFAPYENCPVINTDTLPVLDSDSWPDERKARAYRNYALTYVRNLIPVLESVLGASRAATLGSLTARQTGMQCYDELMNAFALDDTQSASFARLLHHLYDAAGVGCAAGTSELTVERFVVAQPDTAEELADTLWLELLRGLLAAHNRHLSLTRTGRLGLRVA